MTDRERAIAARALWGSIITISLLGCFVCVLVGVVWSVDRSWRRSVDKRLEKLEIKLTVQPAETLAEIKAAREDLARIEAMLNRREVAE